MILHFVPISKKMFSGANLYPALSQKYSSYAHETLYVVRGEYINYSNSFISLTEWWVAMVTLTDNTLKKSGPVFELDELMDLN